MAGVLLCKCSLPFFGHIPLVAPATGACLTRLRRICSWQRATCTCCTTRRRMHTAQPHVMTLCDESDATLDLMEPVKIRKANETEQKATQVLFHQSSAVATGDLTTSCNHPIPIHPISLAVSWSLRRIRMPPWTTTSTWKAPPDRRLQARVALIPSSTARTLGKKNLGGTPSVEHGYGKRSVYTGWNMFF